MILMATSGKQLSSLPSASSIAGNNEFLTWVGNDTAQKVSRDDFIKSLPTYRQPNTAYTLGQIAYHSALPTGWYLECTTPGITGSGDITPGSTIGSTVSDGAVTWTIRQGASTTDLAGYLPLSGGILVPSPGHNYTEIRPNTDDSGIVIRGATVYNKGAFIALLGKDNPSSQAGSFLLQAHNGNNERDFRGYPNGDLTWNNNDLAGSAIVAKSLGSNGYVKYASGLIVQWGQGIIGNNSPVVDNCYRVTIAFPIFFSNVYFITGSIIGKNGNSLPYVSKVESDIGNAYISIPVSQLSNTSVSVDYIAIGV
jgi:hypothetical protein